ncbi:MAPEG family protein [Microbulbifer guangxiensis]|uniref:MAPEG family protein n=1 Tax=Microbulbifer guangxiensis TaxID=2904249 RepID=UPI001F1C8288|nr:MAPEG family protein [Microbulbifer guangxiensis]
MTVAFWCLLAAAIMPYLFTLTAKFTGEGRYDNRAPRAYLESQRGLAQRADWAQRNSFEALPIFVAAVLAGAVSGVPDQWLAMLALGFIAFRVLYGVCYLKDWAGARSLMWSGGYLCCLVLLVQAALASSQG